MDGISKKFWKAFYEPTPTPSIPILNTDSFQTCETSNKDSKTVVVWRIMGDDPFFPPIEPVPSHPNLHLCCKLATQSASHKVQCDDRATRRRRKIVPLTQVPGHQLLPRVVLPLLRNL